MSESFDVAVIGAGSGGLGAALAAAAGPDIAEELPAGIRTDVHGQHVQLEWSMHPDLETYLSKEDEPQLPFGNSLTETKVSRNT